MRRIIITERPGTVGALKKGGPERRGPLDTVRVAWYRQRLGRGVYDAPAVLDAIAARIAAEATN